MKKQMLRCVARLVGVALMLASCGSGNVKKTKVDSKDTLVAESKSPTYEALKTKAESGDVEAQTELGMQYFEKGQNASHEGGQGAEYYNEAAKWLFRLVGQGDIKSLNVLYSISQVDDPEVQAFFKKSVSDYLAKAEVGDTQAQYLVAVMYHNGLGIGKDDAKAMTWIRKAADQGYATAQFNLGLAYANGEGVAQNNVESVKWFLKASEQGHVSAQYNIGIAYLYGVGVAKDYVESVKWFRKAADQGHASAQYNLGVAYVKGDGVAQDYAEAVNWFRKAADQGHVQAQNNLGIRYAMGEGVAKDDAKAEEWFRKAAGQGHVEAQSNLGMQYFEKGQKASHEGGQGAEYYNEAAKWLFRSLGQGDSMSLNLLDVIHQVDDPEVQAYFNTSVSEYLAKAEAGDAEAQYLVGMMYLNGMGIGEDDAKAEEWIRKAAAQGHQAARQWVDEIPYYE